jgi:hypothetical protein
VVKPPAGCSPGSVSLEGRLEDLREEPGAQYRQWNAEEKRYQERSHTVSRAGCGDLPVDHHDDGQMDEVEAVGK